MHKFHVLMDAIDNALYRAALGSGTGLTMEQMTTHIENLIADGIVIAQVRTATRIECPLPRELPFTFAFWDQARRLVSVSLDREPIWSAILEIVNAKHK